ncbi:hypothetical protein J14TS2_16290 [Bacillus sp. J14TS2]|nr:hypothetical protein J14TS2_16290 [Bacillus sp. J14TS2]
MIFKILRSIGLKTFFIISVLYFPLVIVAFLLTATNSEDWKKNIKRYYSDMWKDAF